MFLVSLPHPDLPGLLHPQHDQVHLLAQGLGEVIQLLPPPSTIVIVALAEAKTNLRMQFYSKKCISLISNFPPPVNLD